MTIDDILTAFALGTYDQELAGLLLHGLMEQQARERFACAALTGMIATGVRKPSLGDVAKEAFEYADCMVEASASTAQP